MAREGRASVRWPVRVRMRFDPTQVSATAAGPPIWHRPTALMKTQGCCTGSVFVPGPPEIVQLGSYLAWSQTACGIFVVVWLTCDNLQLGERRILAELWSLDHISSTDGPIRLFPTPQKPAEICGMYSKRRYVRDALHCRPRYRQAGRGIGG